MRASFTLALCALAAGCDAPAESPNASRADVVRALAEQVAEGHYADFAAQAATLSERAVALCAAPDAATLAEAQAAWWAAKAPWARAEVIQFGPVVEYPERLGPKLDDWPVSAEAVEALIASDDALDVAAFGLMGSATRGLPVVEYLLWSVDGDDLGALLAAPRRCEALVGASGDVAGSAARLEQVWREDWMLRVGRPSPDDGDAYDTVQDALDEWVNRMAFTAENIRGTKLGAPVGDKTGGEPQLDLLQSRLSGRSLTDARDALAGVQDVWTGGDGDAPLGVRDLLRDDPTLSAQIDALLAASDARLAELPEPLEDTILLQPELVVRAQDALLALQVAVQVDLAQRLSVTITFNDNDGD
ncbi:imelysin family protein [Myxococcota bacterium]|nr:imelysin family protein [Myxococcota bacterium]